MSAGFNEAAGFTRRKPDVLTATERRLIRFNEAAGFTRRKPPDGGSAFSGGDDRFNEAAGFTRRKPDYNTRAAKAENKASMRPPDLPGGNGERGSDLCADQQGLQ